MTLDQEINQEEESRILDRPFLWLITAASVIPMDYAIRTYVVPLFDWIYK